MGKIIKAVFTGRFCKTARVFQFDTDDKLQIVNVDLPANYTVDFSNSKTGDSVSALATSDTVQIPPDLFVPGSEIYAWIWLSDSNGGHTRCEATIPIDPRARRTGTEPTPAQASAWDEAVDTLNETIEGIPTAINSALTEAKESGEFDGEDGYSPTVTITEITDGHRVTITDEEHPGGQSFDVLDGQGGSGGSSDYDDLSNKPQINGNTLSGNKTAADLGLAPAGAYVKPSGGIPRTDFASAVQTSLDKADTALQQHQSLAAYREATAQDVIDQQQNTAIAAKYAKPSGGIPKTDLASEVQTSLGKADTALQSVPSTYRTAAAQDTIDEAQNGEISSKIGYDDKPNMLTMTASGGTVTCFKTFLQIYAIFYSQRKTYFILAASQTDYQLFTIDRVDGGNQTIYLSSVVGGVLSQIVLTPDGSSTMTGTLSTIDLNLQNASGVSF